MGRIIVYMLLLLPATIAAQARQFIATGKIEFERKTNQHAMMDENSSWGEMLKKNTPKFVTSYMDLSFNQHHSLYKPGRESDEKQVAIMQVENIVFTDLDNNTAIIQKNIFGSNYLITDSVRKIEWKIGTEIRKIAGFDCRKAVGRVMDSIVVIAFYTDEIIATAGPESFCGLPGMILGLAIPQMHTTWYATKLELIPVTDNELAAPKKGKKYTGDNFRKELKDIIKSWGEGSDKYQWQILL